MLTIYFVTSNPEKLKDFEEVQRRFKGLSMSGEQYNDLPEVLGSSCTDLIEKKALAAFEHFRRPIVVDHASLQISRFNGLPGPASKPFWAAIGPQLYDILSKLAADEEDQAVFAATVRVDVSYCDARRIISDFAEVRGVIVRPSGSRFDWDQSFSPDGARGQSYADMDAPTKYQYSARSKAFEKLLTQLKTHGVSWR